MLGFSASPSWQTWHAAAPQHAVCTLSDNIIGGHQNRLRNSDNFSCCGAETSRGNDADGESMNRRMGWTNPEASASEQEIRGLSSRVMMSAGDDTINQDSTSV